MARERKTVDVWEFWLDYGYGDGPECETIELSRDAMRENRRLYREAGFSPRICKRRVPKDQVETYDPQRPPRRRRA